MRSPLAVTRVGSHVIAAHDGLALECRLEYRSGAGVAEALKRFSRRTRERVELIGISRRLRYVVEERAELCTAELRRRIGDRLKKRLQLEIRRNVVPVASGSEEAGRVAGFFARVAL